MSTTLQQIFEQVNQLSRAEQLFLLSSIAQMLSEKEAELLPGQPYRSTVSPPNPTITRGDKSIDPTSLFGIWADKPRNLQDIRQKAWERD